MSVMRRSARNSASYLSLVMVTWLAACPLTRQGREETTPSPAPTPHAVEVRLAQLELLVLEREAEREELQQRLDEARREVVRAMAKLQSLASRAEAASAIAEAELALQGLRRRSGGGAAPEAAQAAQLIEMSTAEFDRQNHGGALYLATQAKNLAGTRRARFVVERGDQRPGEAPFAVPLRLRSLAASNVREGPGMHFPVVFTLAVGAPVLAHSAVEEWVRITNQDGRSGWIFVTLVGRR